MKKIKKNIFKFNIILLVVLFILSPSLTRASWTDIGKISGFANPTSILQEMLFDTLGFDENETAYTAKTMDVARRKKNPPQVSLYFNPPNPEFGEKITATAAPIYFLNNPKDLYFTWFLKPKKCTDVEDKKDYKYNADCDLNDDKEITIEDHKIRAMRIVANAGFDFQTLHDKNPPETDDDGYEAVWGGDDQKGKQEYCFIHDIEKGDEYEIECNKHLFPEADNTGDGYFEKEEERFWHTDWQSNDTARTGNIDEANVAGLGATTFTWNYIEGDKIGVVVEGVSHEGTQTEDASYRTMWAAPNGLCKNIDVSTSIDDNYPITTTKNISTTADSPIVGQTTTVDEITYKEISYSGSWATIKTYVVERTRITTPATGAIISEEMVDPNSIDSATGAERIVSSITDASYTSETFELDKDDFSIEKGDIAKVSDLDDCLYDNLVTPSEMGAQSNRLDVSLFYSPLSPINDTTDPDTYDDPSLSTGDTVTLTASIPNSKNADYVKYEWHVYMSDDADPAGWGSVLTKEEIPDSTQTMGLGLNTFKFKMNFNTSKKYLIVKVIAKENVGDDLYREGNDVVIIPVLSSDKQITAYNAVIEDGSLNLSLSSNPICTEKAGPIVCPVLKNQIIGMRVEKGNLSDFMWTIDNKPFNFKECFFDGCDPELQNETAYFPIIKDPGETYTIGLTAIDQQNGDKVSLTRVFKVVDPKIDIVCEEKTCEPVLLGKYIDTTGKTFEDFSKLNYWALANSPIKLKGDLGYFSASPENFAWNIDGNAIASSDNYAYPAASIDADGILTLSPLDAEGEQIKNAGESYNITLSTLYYPDNLTKQALQKHWSVSYNQFYEKTASDDIIITLYDSNPITGEGSNKKIFASAYSSAPAYLAFLLRIVLTISLILFVSRLVFSFSPKSREDF